jgi:hypothetical protein
MEHIDDRQMDAYTSGLLAEPLLAQAEEHLLVCYECQQRLVQADEFAALFREAVQQPAESRAGWRRFWTMGRTAAWAGAAMVAVLAVVVPLQVREGPPSTIVLRSLRGPKPTLGAASRKPMRLVFDVPAAEAGRVRVVNQNGDQVAQAASEVDNGAAVAKISGLGKGTYWVRVYAKVDPAELLAEYGLLVP